MLTTLRRNFQQPTSLGYLALIRITLGIHWLVVGVPKLGMPGPALAGQLTRTAAADPVALHRAFITGFVIPNADVFSLIVAYGEVAIGISLVLGLLVRVFSALAAFHNLNILLAIAIPVGGFQVPINLYFIVAELAFLFTGAGRALGLDALLNRFFRTSFF